MVIIEETNRNKLGNPERPDSREGPDEVPFQKIIDFKSGRKALEKASSEKEQIRAKLTERSRLPGRLPNDWPEFLVTITLFFAFLLDLYVGLTWSFRF
jgi:hypothetical protein